MLQRRGMSGTSDTAHRALFVADGCKLMQPASDFENYSDIGGARSSVDQYFNPQSARRVPGWTVG